MAVKSFGAEMMTSIEKIMNCRCLGDGDPASDGFLAYRGAVLGASGGRLMIFLQVEFFLQIFIHDDFQLRAKCC